MSSIAHSFKEKVTNKMIIILTKEIILNNPTIQAIWNH